MITTAWLNLLFPVFLVAIGLFAAVSALIEYRQRVGSASTFVLSHLQQVDRGAGQLTKRKNSWLDHWFGWSGSVPHLADLVTLSRWWLIRQALIDYRDGHHTAAVVGFTLGWSTDLWDGAIARIRERRTGRKSHYGKYLDVGIDLMCFIAMVKVLHHWFANWLIFAFGVTIVIRALYGLGLFLRRWIQSIHLEFLPDSNTGKYKTIFVATAFGLVIAWPETKHIGDWAMATMSLAMALEVVSLGQQFVRFQRLRHEAQESSLPKVIPFPRTERGMIDPPGAA